MHVPLNAAWLRQQQTVMLGKNEKAALLGRSIEANKGGCMVRLSLRTECWPEYTMTHSLLHVGHPGTSSPLLILLLLQRRLETR